MVDHQNWRATMHLPVVQIEVAESECDARRSPLRLRHSSASLSFCWDAILTRQWLVFAATTLEAHIHVRINWTSQDVRCHASTARLLAAAFPLMPADRMLPLGVRIFSNTAAIIWQESFTEPKFRRESERSGDGNPLDGSFRDDSLLAVN